MTSSQQPAATRPPLHEVAHLGHIELLTPEPDASLRFFVDVLGLTETGREGNSVYLRTWDDYEHHTAQADRARHLGHPQGGAASLEPGRPRGPGGGDRGDRARHRLEGRRSGDRAHVPVLRSRRARDGAVLGNRVVHAAGRTQAVAEEPGSGLPGARRLRPATGPRQLPRPGRAAQRGVRPRRARRPGHRADHARRRHDLRAVAALHQQGLRPGVHPGLDRHGRAAAPRRVRAGHPRGHLARGGYLPGPRGVHRDRTAQARDPADVLPVRLRAGREPDRAVQPGRPAGAGPGLAHDHLDGGRTGQGPGVGPEDDRVLPHPRNPAGLPLPGALLRGQSPGQRRT